MSLSHKQQGTSPKHDAEQPTTSAAEQDYPRTVNVLTRETGKPWEHLQSARRTPKHVTAFDRWMVQRIFQLVGQAAFTIRLWNGEEFSASKQPSKARLTFKDRGILYRLIINPELYFGDLYSSGRIDFDGSMVSFLEEVYDGLEKSKSNPLLRLMFNSGYRRITNTLTRARDNIHHHYDISNDFYRLWLDTEEMQYTCAYFPNPAMSLEEAQVAKLHHICRKLQLKPGETVVEAGCGWGGLARFMAKHYGVKVKAYNISHQQVMYAREQARQQGLSEQVEYVEDDYRNISGTYDVFVSVGMLEHVGSQFYPVLGEVVARCLKSNGRGLIHSIGRNVSGPMNAWIERRIFPGAYPPTLREMMHIFEPNELSVQDVENLRLHYAKTLEHWLLRFEQHQQTISTMFDEEFVRAWRLYLAGSIAAFTTGQLQLFQIVFNRAQSNHLPWSRIHIYRDYD